ncbi:hypothetical protein E8E15_008781 [Penicillium rubens]|nr:hypothetical protein E8E15_008781 [Penicillium rubens]
MALYIPMPCVREFVPSLWALTNLSRVSVCHFETFVMANPHAPARRNGVIGFQMAGAPTPAIPHTNNQGPPHGITAPT